MELSASRRVAASLALVVLCAAHLGAAQTTFTSVQGPSSNFTALDAGGGQSLNFTLTVTAGTLPQSTFVGATYWVGNSSVQLFPCAPQTPADYSAATQVAAFNMLCTTAAGYGPYPGKAQYSLYSSIADAPSSPMFSYEKPTQMELSVRTNVTNIGGRIVNNPVEFRVGDANITTVYLNGRGFYPDKNVMSVRYGLASVDGSLELYWPCELLPELTTSTQLACNTTLGAYGRALVVEVMVAGWWTPPLSQGVSNRIAYSNAPVINTVKGCNATSFEDPQTPGVFNPDGTANCPTAGGLVMTITGSNMFAPLSVYVNGAAECRNIHCTPDSTTCPAPGPCPGAAPGSCLQCRLPVGTGVRPSLAVTLSPDPTGEATVPPRFTSSDSVYLMSYSLPKVTHILGCEPVTVNGELADTQIKDCRRTGGNLVTLVGTNFGAQNAKILVGGSLGESVQHAGGVAAHSQLTFLVPKGSGTSRSVILLQSGGTLNRDQISLSYFQCPPGTRQTGPDGLNCTDCEPGTYNPNSDAFTCSVCGTGTYSGNKYGASECKACEPGRSRDGTTSDPECKLCEVGSEQPAQGQKSCNPCPAGKYSNAPNTTSCSECPAQHYSDRDASTSCKNCTGIVFQNSVGQTACQSCLAGQYYNGDSCSLCPTGAICDGAKGIVTTDDYYVYYANTPGDEPPILQSVQCLPQYCEECPVIANSTNLALTGLTKGLVFSCCGANRPPAAINPLCGKCDTGYTIYGNVCVPCSETDGGIVFLLIVMQWLYVTVFHWFAQIDNADLRIFLNFIQFVFLFLAAQASNLTAWLSLFNFNILTSVSTTCVAPLTDMQSLASGIYVPLFGFALLGVNIGIHYVVWRFMRRGYCAWKLCVDQKYESRNPISNMIREQLVALRTTDSFYTVWNMYRRTALGFLANSYTSVSQSVFTFFSCIPVNGDKFVQAYPSISCEHDPEYLRLYPLFVVLTFVLCAIPVAVGLRLWMLNRQGLLFGRKDIKLIYGSVIESYAPSKYAWECWVLIRRIVLCSIALDTFPDNLPQKFTYLCMCNILFLGVHYLARPYVLAMDNYAESLSLITLTLMTLFLISAPNPLPSSYAIGLTVMAFLVAGAFVLRILLTRYEYMYRMKKEADRKRKEKELNLDQPKADLANDEDFYAAEAEAEAEAEAAANGDGGNTTDGGVTGGDGNGAEGAVAAAAAAGAGSVALDVKSGDEKSSAPGDVEMVTIVDINQPKDGAAAAAAAPAAEGAGDAAAAPSAAAVAGELKNDDDFYASEAAADAGAADATAAAAPAVDPSTVVVEVPTVSAVAEVPLTPPPQYTPMAAAHPQPSGNADGDAPLAPADPAAPTPSSDS